MSFAVSSVPCCIPAARRTEEHHYRGQPPYAIFGVGPYTFAPWKIAISGLYKRCVFRLVGPRDTETSQRPVVLDDTCYFLPFTSKSAAKRALAALQSPLAQDFLTSRVFWDAKRPINKALLQSLDLGAVLAPMGCADLHFRLRMLSPARCPEVDDPIW